jgi:hypothetical protein
MDAALPLRWATGQTERIGEGVPRLAMASWDDPTGAEPGPTAWPVLWARCWARVRSWRVPPRWSARNWWDEASALGALADSQARRDFDPRRGVPLDAFPYSRVVDAVWTRYRQEVTSETVVSARRPAVESGVSGKTEIAVNGFVRESPWILGSTSCRGQQSTPRASLMDFATTFARPRRSRTKPGAGLAKFLRSEEEETTSSPTLSSPEGSHAEAQDARAI